VRDTESPEVQEQMIDDDEDDEDDYDDENEIEGSHQLG
jgi:hypothetical protein